MTEIEKARAEHQEAVARHDLSQTVYDWEMRAKKARALVALLDKQDEPNWFAKGLLKQMEAEKLPMPEAVRDAITTLPYTANLLDNTAQIRPRRALFDDECQMMEERAKQLRLLSKWLEAAYRKEPT